MKTQTGWIIEIVRGALKQEHGRTFYGKGFNYATRILIETSVLPTRRQARSLADSEEVVRKVLLDTQGRAIQIIPGR